MQPVWLCLLWPKFFEETYKEAWCRQEKCDDLSSWADHLRPRIKAQNSKWWNKHSQGGQEFSWEKLSLSGGGGKQTVPTKWYWICRQFCDFRHQRGQQYFYVFPQPVFKFLCHGSRLQFVAVHSNYICPQMTWNSLANCRGGWFNIYFDAYLEWFWFQIIYFRVWNWMSFMEDDFFGDLSGQWSFTNVSDSPVYH